MLRKLLPHVSIIISVMYFVFYFIDRVNPSMAFINNKITKGLLFALCVITIFNAICMIRDNRIRERQRQQRLRQQRQRRMSGDRLPEDRRWNA